MSDVAEYPASCEVHDPIEILDEADGFITICGVCGEDL